VSEYFTRSHWGADVPVKTLPASKHLKGVCLHWMGFTIHDDPLVVVKSIQRNHMGPPHNWWDIAYNELISQQGEVIEGRGLTARCGANGNTTLNKSYLALGLLIGPGQTPTEEMVTAVRERIAVVRSFQPQADKIVGHKDLKPTTCPGPEVTRMLRAGMFDPSSGDLTVTQTNYFQIQIDGIKEEMTRIYRKVEALEASVQ